ncbi:MAG TPA: signal peptidase I [Treponemataceae bacterium]|nr:signal peptidase I [Treponemataceae bacterium]HPS44275.1 signal peptidase I [Treponemataceae bacterium]
MNVLLILCASCAALFSAFCFSPSFDGSFFAFPLSLAATVLVSALACSFAKGPSRRKLTILRKCLEYLPFILFAAFIIRRSGADETGFAVDLASALLWIAVSAIDIVILFRLAEKRIARAYPSIGPAPHTKWSLALQALEWVDALLQAACLVLLINLFIFQLYAIPSESMVPEFMIGDRVVVLKTPSGPKFPLSEVGIPRMRSFKRGDIVVFNNPHYNDTKADRVKSFASQLVYMLSFTSVNINRDDFGNVKADPLVKRITGVPGEKLMIVDGVLYSRRAGEKEFTPVADDARWATWNVDALPRSEHELVKTIPMTKENYDTLLSIESSRTNLDEADSAREARELVARFERLKPVADTVAAAPDLFPLKERDYLDMFTKNDEITRKLLTTNGGLAWFRAFMTDWAKDSGRKNLYDRGAFHIDLMMKLDFGRLVVRNAELFVANATQKQFESDAERASILTNANAYNFFMSFYDQRDMMEFPAGDDEYIPANNYFMMGDNRFNSLDMRHSYEKRRVAIDPKDPLSMAYVSYLAPRYVPVSRILGSAQFRFWPLTRAGLPE